MEENKKDIAIEVKEYRRNNQLSRKALADLIPCHERTIARIEAGENEPSYHIYQKLIEIMYKN